MSSETDGQYLDIENLICRSYKKFDAGVWEENWSQSLGLSMVEKYKAGDDRDMEMQTAAAVTESG